MNDNVQAPVPQDHPMMVAWKKYQAEGPYANTRQWALHDAHVDGSLWAAFTAGFKAAVEQAAAISESVDNASNSERHSNTPGCDAMGAVIEYRDKIREMRFP